MNSHHTTNSLSLSANPDLLHCAPCDSHGAFKRSISAFSQYLDLVLKVIVVKLQLQTQRSAVDRVYKGPIDCARQIVQARGVLGLWSGFTGSLAFRSNFLWMFGSFEVLMRSFSKLDGTPYAVSRG